MIPWMGNGFTIDAAGTGLRVTADDHGLEKAIADRYAAFPFAGRPDLEVHVTTRPVPDSEELDRLGVQHTLNRADRLYLRDRTFCGVLHPDGRPGSIQVAESDPVTAFGLSFRHLFTRLAVDNGWTFVHAAGILRDHRAYLFAGPSGAGKSTIAGMLDPLPVIHDDQLFLHVGDQGPCIRAVPFMGNSAFVHDRTGCWPVEAVHFLRQDTSAFLVPMAPAMALARILAVPLDGLGAEPTDAFMETVRIGMERCRELVQASRCSELHFTLSELPEGITRPDGEGTS
ncbi:MAG: hypothetical protein ISR64_03015 [Deltaproteobacteria bacterium]|nr:hypothetical protein [Deltaproteobacteria bacterium]